VINILCFVIPLEIHSEEGVILLVYPVVCILSERSGIRIFHLCERERERERERETERERPIDMNNSYSNITASKSYSLRCYNLTNLNWYGYS